MSRQEAGWVGHCGRCGWRMGWALSVMARRLMVVSAAGQGRHPLPGYARARVGPYCEAGQLRLHRTQPDLRLQCRRGKAPLGTGRSADKTGAQGPVRQVVVPDYAAGCVIAHRVVRARRSEDRRGRQQATNGPGLIVEEAACTIIRRIRGCSTAHQEWEPGRGDPSLCTPAAAVVHRF